MLSFEISDADTSATVTVEHEGREWDHGAYRQRYAYSIITPEWRYDGNDIRSGNNAPVDEPDAARTLFSFLSACAESRQYVTRNGGMGENVDLFPDYVGQWAEENSNELSMLSLDTCPNCNYVLP